MGSYCVPGREARKPVSDARRLKTSRLSEGAVRRRRGRGEAGFRAVPNDTILTSRTYFVRLTSWWLGPSDRRLRFGLFDTT